MRRNKRDGLNFSFGLRQVEPSASARSTPKFPSIQINNNNISQSQRRNYTSFIETEKAQIKKSPSELLKDMGGGGVMLFKRERKSKEKMIDHLEISPFLLDQTKSVSSAENKSIKSARSLKERIVRKIEKKKIIQPKNKIHFSDRHSSSLANILELKLETPIFRKMQDKKQLIRFKTTDIVSAYKSQSKKEQSKLSPELKDTMKIHNNFFQTPPEHNIQFRQTKRIATTLERSKLNLLSFDSSERHKNKIFKSYFQKVRPTLRLNTRGILNNQKIEAFAKNYQEFIDRPQ